MHAPAQLSGTATTRILIVDDNAPVRQLLSLTLSALSGEIREARTGTEALECIEAWDPTLVVLDVMMPGEIDGLEVCRRTKDAGSGETPLVIMLSARGQAADVENGHAAGADAYLVKPVSPLKLLALAEGMLSQRR